MKSFRDILRESDDSFAPAQSTKRTNPTPAGSSVKLSPEFTELLNAVSAEEFKRQGLKSPMPLTKTMSFVYDALANPESMQHLVSILKRAGNARVMKYLMDIEHLAQAVKVDPQTLKDLAGIRVDPKSILELFSRAFGKSEQGLGRNQAVGDLARKIAGFVGDYDHEAQDEILSAFSGFAERKGAKPLADSIRQFMGNQKWGGTKTNFQITDEDIKALDELLRHPNLHGHAEELISRWLESHPDLAAKIEKHRTPPTPGELESGSYKKENALSIIRAIVDDYEKMPQKYDAMSDMNRRKFIAKALTGMTSAGLAGTIGGFWAGRGTKQSEIEGERQKGYDSGRKEGFLSANRVRTKLNGLPVTLGFDNEMNVTAQAMGGPETADKLYRKTYADLLNILAQSGLTIDSATVKWAPAESGFSWTFPVKDRSKFTDFKVPRMENLCFREWLMR